jgi:hypothetical protein
MPQPSTSLPCSLSGCARRATFSILVLKPYVAGRVIDIFPHKTFPHMCASHAAQNHLNDCFTDAENLGAVVVYEPLAKDELTKQLLPYLPKRPERRRDHFMDFQRRAWDAFYVAGHAVGQQEFRLAFRRGKLNDLASQLGLTIPDWCSTPDCPVDPDVITETGEKLCVCCALKRLKKDPRAKFTALPSANELPESVRAELFDAE